MPKVTCPIGSHIWKRDNRLLVWTIPSITDSNPYGTLEFLIQGSDENAFFPTTICFTSSSSFTESAILTVSSLQATGLSLPYSIHSSFTTEEFSII
jgi:hypothetical protein